MRRFDDATFLLLLLVLTVLFGWILWPFYGAILWAIVTALVFAPLHGRMLRAMPGRRSLAAFATLCIIILIVILPFLLIAGALVREATQAYQFLQSGQWNLKGVFDQVSAAVPAWLTDLSARFGVYNLNDIQERVVAALSASSQYLATGAVSIGMGTVGFLVQLAVMLYLLFFLLRDGESLAERVSSAVPMRARRQRRLFDRFKVVVRATVKGGILVALLQGALGGVIFWLLGIPVPLLWAALMALLSLVPAVGAGLVWLPVALYLLATGAVWQGIALIAYGAFVIGLADNVVRPILVGKDTKMPDYLVLISTLGGIEVFGLNGFVMGPVIAAMFIAAWQIFSEAENGPEAGAGPLPGAHERLGSDP